MISRSSMIGNHLAARDEHGQPANLYFLDVSFLPFHVEVDATRAVDEVALFDHKLIPAILRLQTQSTVMNEISAQRTARAARRRIFRNVVGRCKEARMSTRRAYLDRLTCERVTTSAAVTSVDLRKPPGIDANIAQVCERAHRNGETRQTSRDHLYRQTLVEIFAIQAESACDFGLFVRIVDLVDDFEGALSHHHLDGLSIFEFDIDRQNTDADFVKDPLPAVAAVRQWDHAFACQGSPGADNRMARKRNLAHGRKDTQASQRLF